MNFSYKNGNAVFGLNDNFGAMYISDVFKKEKKNILLVTASLFEAQKLFDLVSMYTKDVLFFPMDDFITSASVASSPEFKTNRIETINEVVSSKTDKIIVTHLMGYLRYLPKPKVWKESVVSLKIGDTIDRDSFIKNLYDMGYKREINVIKTGDVSIRGFVIDIYPISSVNPVRIEFFDDEIESIRYFDSNTQKSIEEIKNIRIFSNTEELGNNSSITEYLDNPIVVYKDYNQLKISNELLVEEIFNFNLQNDSHEKHMNDFNDIAVRNKVYLNTIDSDMRDISLDNKLHYKSRSIDNFNGDISKINEYIKKSLGNKNIVLVFNNQKLFNKFEDSLKLKYVIVSSLNKLYKNEVNILINKDIVKGGELEELIILTSKELFGKTSKKIAHKRHFKRGKAIKELGNLQKGDFVVHEIHGVGKYMGVVTLIKKNLKKDYLQILYRNDDKLYIPVEKINYISKYSGRDGVSVRLNKLGSNEWEKTKNRIRNKVKDIAERLIKINASRETAKGHAFSRDTEEQLLFESEFEYILTPDQIVAVSQIKEDMEKESPMDRLLCGDVGYGKTEVAFRAMFKAVMDLKQVAYLCPTTILCKQQYENAISRFKNYGLNIGMLNRFTSKKDMYETIKGLKNGSVDIVFGTHRLLSDDISFKDLGLLVIDEEQRFGVMHKEKIKEYKSNIDILTLSATPIPRTMQMSMVGLRSMSLIETPPAYRHPIQTYVMPENKSVIRDVVYKELSRGGQVFILHNRVDSIIRKVEEMEKIVPDAKITYAHGKMSKTELENRMNSFIEGKYDILICTTIIEIGIDIPNVNTLIIYDSDKFGLSQLYQIRGRVGRSKRQAYAYLLYNEHKVLTETAIKRLDVIKTFTELGSGLSIAMRDLSIRGAGDILGSEQAGFIDSVGIDLYIKILNEEVDKLNGKEIQVEEKDDKPLVEVETHISDKYTTDEEIKIEIHNKINEIDSLGKLNEVKAEIEDRFGIISDEMEIYMYEEWFEKLAKGKVDRIRELKNSIEIVLNKDTSKSIDGSKLFMMAEKISKYITFSYKDEKIIIKIKTNKLKKHYIYLLVILFKRLPVK